ncbi:hypothetical protein N7494_001763 [Penicillium frequentans]|uniref:Uncharacterized protein n=1 Tax=Penicillium frequentans TaxID=3151616 RepID=A0AAD6GJT8_9EURO|nr:hypothetical protein N7494_001763 [Penicillium glabrum]
MPDFLDTLESFVGNTPWKVGTIRYEENILELCYVLNLVLPSENAGLEEPAESVTAEAKQSLRFKESWLPDHQNSAPDLSSFYESASVLIYSSSGPLSSPEIPSMFVISDSGMPYEIVRSAVETSAKKAFGDVEFHISLGQVSMAGWRSVLLYLEHLVSRLTRHQRKNPFKGENFEQISDELDHASEDLHLNAEAMRLLKHAFSETTYDERSPKTLLRAIIDLEYNFMIMWEKAKELQKKVAAAKSDVW